MRTKTVLEPGMHRGFRKGMNRVPFGSVTQFRKDLRKIIGGESDCKMQYYINGTTIIHKEITVKIERLFKRYGITPDMIWDI